MPEQQPKPKETYDQIGELVAQIKEHAAIQTRIALIENDLKYYVKETDIHKMISEKIKKYDEQREKIDRKGIQWSGIIQQIVIATVICLITYFVVKGAAV